MRLLATLGILAAGVAVSVAVYVFSGGRLMLFFLPLVFALPLAFGRRGRGGG